MNDRPYPTRPADRHTEWLSDTRGLRRGSHACLVHSDREELNAAVVTYVAEGLDQGERCLYILSERSLIEVVDVLGSGGIDVPQRAAEGSLQIFRAQQLYLVDGVFDGGATIVLLARAVDRARADGFVGLRAVGEMGWARAASATAALLAYERRLDRELRSRYDARELSGLCVYDTRLFDPTTVRAVVAAHRVVVAPSERAEREERAWLAAGGYGRAAGAAAMLGGGEERSAAGDD